MSLSNGGSVSLSAQRESVAAYIGMLEELGPRLGAPYTSSVYERFVPIADRLYDDHLRTIKREVLI